MGSYISIWHDLDIFNHPFTAKDFLQHVRLYTWMSKQSATVPDARSGVLQVPNI